MHKRKTRILVVDDEPRYLRVIQVTLEAYGYEVLTAQDGTSAVTLTTVEEPDLILLDIRMPGLDGYTVCQRIREFTNTPIIMLTALAQPDEKIKGLDLGADDYVTKPFNAKEMLARVRAVLRRTQLMEAEPQKQSTFQAGELSIDFVKQRVFIGDQEVHLTPTEYDILSELAQHAGQVLVIDHLLEKVWGLGYEGEKRLVWRVIHLLRQKIEPDPSEPQYIHTRPGIGYVLTAPETTSSGL